jgi:hypothetical protein
MAPRPATIGPPVPPATPAQLARITAAGFERILPRDLFDWVYLCNDCLASVEDVELWPGVRVLCGGLFEVVSFGGVVEVVAVLRVRVAGDGWVLSRGVGR